MLSKINISNLDNSISKTSIYSDAFENPTELEEHYRKMNANKVENLNDNKSDYKNENIYSNNNNIKKNDVDNNKNDLSCSSMNEVYESVIEEKSQLENENFENINEDEKNVESQKNVINLRYLNNRFIGKNESIDILRYRNDKLGILYDNRSENIDLKKSTINKIIS